MVCAIGSAKKTLLVRLDAMMNWSLTGSKTMPVGCEGPLNVVRKTGEEGVEISKSVTLFELAFTTPATKSSVSMATEIGPAAFAPIVLGVADESAANVEIVF